MQLHVASPLFGMEFQYADKVANIYDAEYASGIQDKLELSIKHYKPKLREVWRAYTCSYCRNDS